MEMFNVKRGMIIMTGKVVEEIRTGLETAYINNNINSNLAYKPQFISNNYKQGKKMLSAVEDELLKCDHFQISVAFITMGGITPLLQTLKELEITLQECCPIIGITFFPIAEPRKVPSLL